MFKLCNYSELIGKVGEGIHSYRIFDIAIIDVITTIFITYILQKYLLKNYTFIQVFVGIFILGIIFHRIFCVRTTIDKFLFK